jgi:HAD superfamily hydrolase (TIGR01484 family)
MKKVIVFDLDGTLAESKQSLDSEIAALLSDLLYVKKVGIVSGGGMPQLKKQVISKIPFDAEKFKNLIIFPTKGAAMYEFNGKDWEQIYQKLLSDEQKQKIRNAFEKVLKEVDFIPEKHYGKLLEDRGTQFTFSALGQDAPPALKKEWDPNVEKRQRIRKLLEEDIPEFEIEIGGSTSIDITEKGIDKAFALEQLCKYEKITITDILFIGDALFPGGNDYAVVKTGVDTIHVKDYNETKDVIRNIIAGKI